MIRITLVLLFFSFFSLQAQTTQVSMMDKAEALLRQMTLKEKIGQMVLYNGSWDVTGPPSDADNKIKYEKLKKGEVGAMLNVTTVAGARELQELVMEHSRLKIPLLFGYDVIHGFKTMFPIPLAETASWDLEAIRESARIAAKEATAAGVNWTFAPMIDVSRDARWGRVMEGSGEDPFLTSKTGVARVQGFQGNDLSDKETLAACAKHFAAYGFVDAGRDYNSVMLGDYELNNTILPPFKAVANAGVATFMSAFNDIDGIPATAHQELQRTLLKEEWGWNGFVVSDWASIGELIPHGFAKDTKEAAKKAVLAGNDMDMEGRAYEIELEDLIKEGKVKESLIDDAVKRILNVKFQLGLFQDPYKYLDPKREKKDIYNEEHLAVSEDVARKSIVLLKNENSRLPLSKEQKNIAVIGILADDKDTPLGSWRGIAEANSAVSLIEGIAHKLGNKNDNDNVVYSEGVQIGISERSFIRDLKINKTDTSGIKKAVAVAKQAEIVIMTLGEEAFQSGEARSQVEIELSKPQRQLFEEVYKVNQNIVVVLMNGRPLAIPEIANKAKAILETWHLGSRSGHAIADVLFGDYNPSGKLPVSFPRNVGQMPLYYNYKNTGRPKRSDDLVFWSHYTDEKNEALFPFGYGLSYTTFEYGEIQLSSNKLTKGETLKATITLTNTGNVKGKEVVQLYLKDETGSLTRPIKELKGFELIELEAGQSKKVEFAITEEILKYYTINRKWEVEEGDFSIGIGGDSTVSLDTSFYWYEE